jgi:hypothetical protein
MTLRDLLSRPSVTLDEISRHLASIDGDARVREGTDLARRQQAILWRLAGTNAPLGPDDFVPPSTSVLTPVPFWGQNNQPIFRPFRKVFYRQPDGLLAGYNESSVAPVVGPGYYVLRFDDIGAFVDYTTLPTVAPAIWPKIVPNERGVSQFVYGYMKDYIRRVSGKLYIGRAYRRGQETPPLLRAGAPGLIYRDRPSMMGGGGRPGLQPCGLVSDRGCLAEGRRALGRALVRARDLAPPQGTRLHQQDGNLRERPPAGGLAKRCRRLPPARPPAGGFSPRVMPCWWSLVPRGGATLAASLSGVPDSPLARPPAGGLCPSFRPCWWSLVPWGGASPPPRTGTLGRVTRPRCPTPSPGLPAALLLM